MRIPTYVRRCIIITIAVAACYILYGGRKSIHLYLVKSPFYHELKRKILFASKYKNGNMGMKYYYSPEASGRRTDVKLSPKWWFRPSHMGGFCGAYLVDDTDNDGRPEVYIVGGSKYIYCLDGENGELIWRFTLPFGWAGQVSANLEDVDNDGTKELIFGTYTDFPIRVYCLSTKKNIPKRIKWLTNIPGDFIQGGLVSFRNRRNQIRIIVTTRDAPYARGTLNILNGRGKYICPPIYGVDACNNRPSVADINNDDCLNIVIGSHNFYGAKFGWKVTAFTVKTGEMLWSTPVGFDTGALQFPIVDIGDDGKFEILAGSKILSASDGKIIFDLRLDDRLGISSFSHMLYNRKDNSIYWGDSRRMVSDKTGETIYEFNNFPKSSPQFYLDLDGNTDFLNAYLIAGKSPRVRFYLFDAQTGSLKDTITKNIDPSAFKIMQQLLPCQQELTDFVNHGPTGYWKKGYKEKTLKIKPLNKITRLDFVLADTDNDGYWEAVVNFNAIVFCFDLPFIIPQEYVFLKYRRLSMDPLEDQTGFNYDLQNRAFKSSR